MSQANALQEAGTMTNTFKRRIYRYCVLSAISFFGAFLLYDLGDVGIATNRLLFPCVVLWMVGVLLGFKAADTWSGWDDDTSEDTNVRQPRSNAYPITFYTVAVLMALTVVFLLVFTIIRNKPTTIAEGSVLAFALFVAGVCTFIGDLSSHLE
jgi:drug/metabolite transporter (DMT)-like permease